MEKIFKTAIFISLKLIWFVIIGWFWILCKLIRIIRFGFKIPSALTNTICCPAGHEGSAIGKWRCGSCGAEFEGWVWQNCPVCGESALYIPCEDPRCNLAIKNPFID
jgi:hypothetical protein